ncbi:MAG TPA: hypothetical protein VLX12_03475 [Syntrophorhabdales bacterium]|nr:hypothetical protein [Syntrophorhabdales bacterium]
MKRARVSILSLLLLSACVSIPQRAAVEWPDKLQYIEASGDLSMSWRKVNFSGTVSLQMDYPSLFVLEIYGAFGQTIAYVKKEREKFLLVAGDEKSTDERAFEERYGLRVEDFMDDLAMKGNKIRTDGSIVIDRSNYRVVYDQDRKGRRKMTWEGPDGTMQLLFTQVSFTQGEPNVKDSGGKM